MMKSFYVSSAAILLITSMTLLSCHNSSPVRVLFIGNSYTFNNNLPALAKEMGPGKRKDLSIEIKALTPGGAKLKDHLNSSFTLDTIENGNWDIVVIQGHSLEPLINPMGFSEAATDLIRSIKESGAEAYLFETWARESDNRIYSESWSGENPDAMQELLSITYNEVANASGITVIPIGTVWLRILRERPEIELYSDDGAHPTLLGSYLAACMIHSKIFNADPRGIQFVPAAIKKSEAETIQQFAAAEFE